MLSPRAGPDEAQQVGSGGASARARAVDCTKLDRLTKVKKLGNGRDKQAYSATLPGGTAVVVKRVRVKPSCTADMKCSSDRGGVFKLLKEVELIETLMADYPGNALRHLGTCLPSNTARTNSDFMNQGVSTFFEAGHRIDYSNPGEQWVDLVTDLIWRLHNSSMGSMIPTDVKPDQFMQLRGGWHPTDLDDFYVDPHRSFASLLLTCSKVLQRLVPNRWRLPLRRCAERVLEYGAKRGTALGVAPVSYQGKHACSGCIEGTNGPCIVRCQCVHITAPFLQWRKNLRFEMCCASQHR